MLVPDRLRALVVDDNAYARAATAATLRKLGLVQIVESATGSDALLTLLEHRFDVLFMDWYMPEMSGAALLQTIRDPRFGPSHSVPVVLMTAYPSREVLTAAKALGINDTLTKPFTAANLSAALQRVLAVWQLPDEEVPMKIASGDGPVFL